MPPRGLRSLLECTESFCLSKHWLDPAFVEHVYDEYAEKEAKQHLYEELTRLAETRLAQNKLELPLNNYMFNVFEHI